jgi:purine-nucleoside phosphorylase
MAQDDLYDRVMESKSYLLSRLSFCPSVGIILGTGLGSLDDLLQECESIPYEEAPNFPVSTAPGHPGNLLMGRVGRMEVAVLQGRFHYYEGYSTREITFPIRVLHSLGLKVLIITNSAGGLNPLFEPGDIMGIVDHIHLIPENPLRGLLDERLGEAFPDMSRPYDPVLLGLAQESAIEMGIHMKRGTYVSVPGPSLETPAETRFLRSIGADAVGMSTTAEVIVARSLTLRVLALSLISNVNRPDCMSPILVDEILRVSKESAPRMAQLLGRVLEKIPNHMDI